MPRTKEATMHPKTLIAIAALTAMGAGVIDPASAFAARSSKPKEIVVVGSKINQQAKPKATPKLYEMMTK